MTDGRGRFELAIPRDPAEWPVPLAITRPHACGIGVDGLDATLFDRGRYGAVRIQRLPSRAKPTAGQEPAQPRDVSRGSPS